MMILIIIGTICLILFIILMILLLLTKNINCYSIFCGDYIPKNIFEKIYYKLWLMLGVSPSGLIQYKLEKRMTIFIQGFEKGLKDYELAKENGDIDVIDISGENTRKMQ